MASSSQLSFSLYILSNPAEYLMDTEAIESEKGPTTAPTPVEPEGSFAAYKRIFRYAGPFELSLQTVACVAAVASGAGIAFQPLLLGQFVTSVTDFT